MIKKQSRHNSKYLNMDLSGVVLAILSVFFSPISFALKIHLPEKKVQQGLI